MMKLWASIKETWRYLRNKPTSSDSIQKELEDMKGYLRTLLLNHIGSVVAIFIALFAGFQGMQYFLSNQIDRQFSSIEMDTNSNTSRIDNLYEKLFQNIKFPSEAEASADERKLSKNPGYHSRILLFLQGHSQSRDLYNLTGFKEFENASCAFWSPVSPEIVFLSLTGHDDLQGKICIFNYAINSVDVISELGLENLHPQLSPEGNRIVFSQRDQTDKSRWDIYVYDRNSNEAKRLTNAEDKEKSRVGNRNLFPSWSPDGEWIVFCSDDTTESEEGFALFIMSQLGKHKLNICNLGDVCKTSFSPNGRFLVFETEDGKSQHDIWLAPFSKGRLVMTESELIMLGHEPRNYERIGKYYIRRLTDFGKKKNLEANIDPVWVSDTKIMYIFTDQIRTRNDFTPSDFNWKLRKFDITTGKIIELPLRPTSFRCPQPNRFFSNEI